MSETHSLHIRGAIAQAKTQEQENHALQSYIEERLPTMHPAIALPEGNRHLALLSFVIHYVEHVPDFIDALGEFMQEAKIYEEASQLLELAGKFFTQPPQIIEAHSGLRALTDEAYLAHRLMEEINDRLIMLAGSPLIPMDMTLSNLVIHDLLGDEFANQLDMIVLYTIERSFQNEKLAALVKNDYIEQQHAKQWEEALDKWPCLAGDNSISINLDDGENATH